MTSLVNRLERPAINFHIDVKWFFTRVPIRNGQSCQNKFICKIDIHIQKNEVKLLPYTIEKLTQNESKITIRDKTTKLLEEKYGKSFLTLDLAMIFGYNAKSTSNKRKEIDNSDYTKLDILNFTY